MWCECIRESQDEGRESSATTTAASKTLAVVIDGANHALSEPTHAEEFVAKVEAFVTDLA